MNEIYKNYLEHHGILGQKWGRKNGPPYPLSAGSHSAAEKKAGWRKSLDNGDSDVDRRMKKIGKKYKRMVERGKTVHEKVLDDFAKKIAEGIKDEDIAEHNRLSAETDKCGKELGAFIGRLEAKALKKDPEAAKALEKYYSQEWDELDWHDYVINSKSMTAEERKKGNELQKKYYEAMSKESASFEKILDGVLTKIDPNYSTDEGKKWWGFNTGKKLNVYNDEINKNTGMRATYPYTPSNIAIRAYGSAQSREAKRHKN